MPATSVDPAPSAPPSSSSTVCDLNKDKEKPDFELLEPPVHAHPSSLSGAASSPSHTLPSDPQGVTTPDVEKGANTDTAERPKLTQTRKWGLLAIFSLAMFIDIWMYSAFFIFTDVVSVDLGIPFTQQAWVITSYSVTFAAFLLFWGRVSDLYSAKPVFAWGFTALGTISLVISFLPDMYSFFILRAIAGIAGSALIPSSYRLITEVFEVHELSRAFTLFGMAGALANVTGVIIAGVIDLIPLHGQGASWRWFFRLAAVIVIPFAVMSMFVIPQRRGAEAETHTAKWKRLDLPGSMLMLGGTLLLVLGLTLGAAQGFKTAAFLVPFLLALVVLFPGFFIWEASIPEDVALLPPSFWRIPNTILLIAFALQLYGWIGVNFLAHVESYMKVYRESSLIAALRMLPQGFVSFLTLILLACVPRLAARPRWSVSAGMLAGIVGYVLFVQNQRFVGSDYWKWVFTGSVIGGIGMTVCFTATNVALMTSVDPSVAGVAGALLQVALQVGSSVSFGAQSGLFTVHEGGLANYKNVHASFYFQLGLSVVALVAFFVFYKQPKAAAAP